jgi:serine/threonine protein kinase
VPHANDSSRDLLFGVFALQNGLIDQGQLLAAFQSWTHDKSRSMADHLISRGDLSADDRTAVEFLVARHVQKHGDDIEKSLAAINAGRSTREGLASLRDADIEASLAHVGTDHTLEFDGPGVTVNYGNGAATTADGQRFRVLRPHAQGGLGAVFVALDAELHREVALKQILEQHADNPVSRQRFLLEAEVTGGLEHPGIVPVYGLGTYQDGRPYYAMRFIRGDTLKDALADFHADLGIKNDPGRRSLELRQLLRRFVDVCNAIEYAHGRGVLHRDIKPANIVVGKHGETLVVDWGLAKPLGHGEPGSAAGERTLIPSSCSGTADTLQGSTLGTPAYMSPEQAAGDVENLGPRSDIYSLGATLYCLLTGEPPYKGDMVAALRAVQKGDFRPPRKLDPSIDRGLEAACLKAMALKPDHRYPAPRALAEDIERWMADEPVSALRETFSQRVRRWSRKHRTAVAAAAGLLVTSTVALAVGTVLITREWNEAQAQRNEARAQGQQARQAVHLLTKVADSGFDEQIDPLQKEFLENALAYYEQFTGRVADDPSVKLEHGRAYRQMGDIQRKLGRLQESELAYRSALAMLEPLAGRPNAAREAKDALARTRTLLADLLVRRGADKGEAEPLYQQALDAQQALADAATATAIDHLRLAQTQKSQADLLRLNGQLKPAKVVYDQAIAVLENAHAADPSHSEIRNDLALAFDFRGWIHKELGDLEQAEQDYRHAMEVLDKLVAEFPTVPRFREALAKACNSLGLIEENTGRLADAKTHLMRELPLVERLAQDFPDRPEHRRQLGRTLMNIGNVLSDQNRAEASEPFLRRAVEVYSPIAAKHPDDVQIRFDLAKAHLNLGELLRTRGDVKQAVDQFLTARALNEALVKASPDKPRYRENLAGNLVNLALAHEVHDPPRVEETYRTALAMYEKLVADHPDNADYRIGQAVCIRNFGPVLAAAKRTDEAEALYRQALAVLEVKGAAVPTAQWLRVQASVLNNLGQMLTELGRPEAQQSLRAALAIFQGLLARSPASREDRHNVAIAENNVGNDLVKLDRRLEAAPFFERSAALFEKLVAEAPNEIDLHSHFGIVLEGQGNLLSETGKPVEAKKVLESAVAQQRQAMRLSKDRDSVRALLGGHLIALATIELKMGAFEESAANALELPKIVPASDRGQACLDAARILAQVVAQVQANTKLPETERSRLIRIYLGRTIVLVSEAIDGSPKRSDEIKKDPHIKALESRPEFQTIMNALESAQR